MFIEASNVLIASHGTGCLFETSPRRFLTYMVHDAPRIIVNAAGAYSTNRLHALKLKNSRESIAAWAPLDVHARRCCVSWPLRSTPKR